MMTDSISASSKLEELEKFAPWLAEYANHTLRELELLIRALDHDYMNNLISGSEREVSDQKYDGLRLYFDMRCAEANYEPGMEFAHEQQMIRPMKHVSTMGSLNRTYEFEELEKWVEKQDDEVVAMIKIDGIGFSVRYHISECSTVITRGNGKEGEDITDQCLHIGAVPNRIGSPLTAEVRGELFVTKTDFERINENLKASGQAPYKSPRHAASGLVKRGKKIGYVKAAVYTTGDPRACEAEGKLTSLIETWENFFSKVPRFIVDKSRPLREQHDAFLAELEKQDIPFDGIVYSCNDISQRYAKKLFGPRKPRHSIAFKLPSAKTTAVINGMDCGLNYQGRLVPRALFKDLHLDGYHITALNLHNTKVQHKNSWYPGAVVEVIVRGDTVPVIGETVSPPALANEIKECPGCKKAAKKIDGYLHCPEPTECPGVRLARLVKFFSRSGVNLKGLGEKVLEQMVADGISHPYEIYDMSHEALTQYNGGESISKLRDISKDVGLTRLQLALGIEQSKSDVTSWERFSDEDYKTLLEYKRVGFRALKSWGGVDNI